MRTLWCHVRRAIWRVRSGLWGMRHYHVCGNCRYYGNDFCFLRTCYGDDIEVRSEYPACERWMRLHMEPEMP